MKIDHDKGNTHSSELEGSTHYSDQYGREHEGSTDYSDQHWSQKMLNPFNRVKVCRKTLTGRCLRRQKPPSTPPDGLTPSTAFKIYAFHRTDVPASAGILWYEYVEKDRYFVTAIASGPTDLHDTEIGIYRSDGTLLITNDDNRTNLLTYNSKVQKIVEPGTYYIAVGMQGAVYGATNFAATSPARDNQTDLVVQRNGPGGWPNGLPGLMNTGQYLADGSPDRSFYLTYNDGFAGSGVYLPRLTPANTVVQWSPNDEESGWIGIQSAVGSSGTYIVAQYFDLTDYDHTTVRIEVDLQVATLGGLYVNPANDSSPAGAVFISLQWSYPDSLQNWSTYVLTSANGFVAGRNSIVVKFRGSDPGEQVGIRMRFRGTGTLL